MPLPSTRARCAPSPRSSGAPRPRSSARAAPRASDAAALVLADRDRADALRSRNGGGGPRPRRARRGASRRAGVRGAASPARDHTRAGRSGRHRVVRAGLPAVGAGDGRRVAVSRRSRTSGGGRGRVGAARTDVGAGPPDPRGLPGGSAAADARPRPGSRGSRRTAAFAASFSPRGETREAGALTHSRVFIPHLGIPEDFATGSSHAAIGVWLWETGGLVAADGVARFRESRVTSRVGRGGSPSRCTGRPVARLASASAARPSS